MKMVLLSNGSWGNRVPTPWYCRSVRARISRQRFYANGGLANTRQFRKGTRGGWSYWEIVS